MAAATGCGSNEEHDAFVARANAVCVKHAKQFATIEQPRSIEQLFRRVARVREITQSQIRELRAIRPPKDDAEDYRAMLAAIGEMLKGYEEFQQAVLTGRPGEDVIQEIDAADARARERADALGLEECAAQPA